MKADPRERIGRRLTVATYNVWGSGEPWHYTATRGITRGAVPGSPATTLRLPGGIWPRRRRLLVRALERVRADVIALQEVGEIAETGGRSQAHEIAHDLGYRCIAAPPEGSNPHALDRGLSILSPHPIAQSAYLPLPPEPNADFGQQTALHARVEAPAGPIEVITVHLTPRSEEAQIAAVDFLRSYLAALPTRSRVVVAGDFNATPASRPLRLITGAGEMSAVGVALRDAWAVAHPLDPGPTMPSHAPVSRIDYLLVGSGLDVVDAARIGAEPDDDGFYPSDHLGLAATVDVRGDTSGVRGPA